MWLIYRCATCAATWNCPVIARRRVADIARTEREAFECNDAQAAWRHAIDIDALRRGGRVELCENILVERGGWREQFDEVRGDVVLIDTPCACAWRLDRLLARELHISRTELQQLYEAARLLVSPTQRDALRKPVRHGQSICFVGGLR